MYKLKCYILLNKLIGNNRQTTQDWDSKKYSLISIHTFHTTIWFTWFGLASSSSCYPSCFHPLDLPSHLTLTDHSQQLKSMAVGDLRLSMAEYNPLACTAVLQHSGVHLSAIDHPVLSCAMVLLQNFDFSSGLTGTPLAWTQGRCYSSSSDDGFPGFRKDISLLLGRIDVEHVHFGL